MIRFLVDNRSAWKSCREVYRNNDEIRIDRYGRLIVWDHYQERQSKFGWVIYNFGPRPHLIFPGEYPRTLEAVHFTSCDQLESLRLFNPSKRMIEPLSGTP